MLIIFIAYRSVKMSTFPFSFLFLLQILYSISGDENLWHAVSCDHQNRLTECTPLNKLLLRYSFGNGASTVLACSYVKLFSLFWNITQSILLSVFAFLQR